MLWEVDLVPKPPFPDREGEGILAQARECGLSGLRAVRTARGFLLEGELTRADVERIAAELLADPVVEECVVRNLERTTENRARSAEPLHAPDAVGPSGSRLSTLDSRLLPTLDSRLSTLNSQLLTILRKPGVMDPVALSCEKAVRDLGLEVQQVRTCRKYWVEADGNQQTLALLARRVLANESIEQVVYGELALEHLGMGSPYRFRRTTVPLREMDDAALESLSREGQLYLSLREMQAIRDHFRRLDRDPTDAELETLAQTWSEHCSHKTLKGRIDYEERDRQGTVIRRLHFDNLLKETIFAATQEIRRRLGRQRDWCISVFEDNAGIVRFDERFNAAFKVETHNHPSAIEPYGGANTGLGGVIRDVLGTGLGAKPVAGTDVFCFAPPDLPFEQLPPGVLHPKRVMKGVVAGVRDYGNRMGIPTVNGAIYFDPRYLGNPLVYCGTVGIIPVDKCRKEPRPGDLIVAVGGRTGRDGIHGATFSSAQLTQQSEAISGGAVQIGNAITEKMMLDVLLAARDRGLYTATTDCGAGGFSSAVGEMGAAIGAEVWLERAPLKYQGLSYSEIWISESQERMVLAVPPEKWNELRGLCASEDVEATVIGEFRPTSRLVLKYREHVVADLDMDFLHGGRPPVIRHAVYCATQEEPRRQAGKGSGVRREGSGVGGQGSGVGRQGAETVSMGSPPSASGSPPSALRPPPSAHSALRTQHSTRATHHSSLITHHLKRILSSLNVCSREWVIRQYDHEVQGGSVVKPLVGAANDGPSDAAVLRPVLGSYRGLAIACGMNPRYGDLDPYGMAASAIDEAVRNCVAVGADPARIALLDNFCWGNTDWPEVLGSLVRAALACRDVAVAYGTPFISGKDSLNNEFTYLAPGDSNESAYLARADSLESAYLAPDDPPGAERQRLRTITIPPSLLISALGQVDDVRRCVTMDLKEPGNLLYLVGATKDELGGSHYHLVNGLEGGQVPAVDLRLAPEIFRRVHDAIRRGLVRSCHDLSEGGLAVGLAEMAFAGGLGAEINLPTDAGVQVGNLLRPPDDPQQLAARHVRLLFSESNSRFLLEVRPDHQAEFLDVMRGAGSLDHRDMQIPLTLLGHVVDEPTLTIADRSSPDREPGESIILQAPVAELKDCWQRPLRWGQDSS